MPFESNNRDFCSKCEAHHLEATEGGEDFVNDSEALMRQSHKRDKCDPSGCIKRCFFSQLRKGNINAIVPSSVVILLIKTVCNSAYPELFQKMS